jgi:branched-chain amino acid transport system permease protein
MKLMKQKQFLKPRTLISLAIWISVLILIFIVPGKLNNYHLTIINMAIIYFIAALEITIMLGMGGSLPLSTVSFIGMSAFFTAQLAKYFGLPTVWAGVLSVAATSLIAYILSIMLVRLTGFYFVFGTLGLSSMMATIFQNYKPLTGGADGISGIPKLNLFGFEFKELSDWFVLLALIAFIAAFITERIRKSSLGRGLMSIRDNPIAAQTLGIDILRTKRIAFTIGATFAALAGTLIAFHNGVVSSSLFTNIVQINLLTMVFLGGVDSTFGALGGAFIVQLLPEVLRPIQDYLRLVYGVLLILLMIFMPMGINGIIKSSLAKIKRYFAKKKGGLEVGETGENPGR